MCLAGKGAGGRGSHTSPGRGWKERDTALLLIPWFCVCEHHSVTLTSEAHQSIHKGKEHKPSCPQSRARPALFGKQVLQGRGGEYTWLQRLGVSIISAILQMLKVTRILYFPLLQDVLMNQCGKTTGLNLMVLYNTTPYYIMLALKTGSEQPSFECIEL